MAELRVTTLLGFFQNDDNQVNIGDPIEDIMISEYHSIYHLAMKWLRMQICPLQKFHGGDVTSPNPCLVLGHRDVQYT